MINGVDVTLYEEIPRSVDYFFDLVENSPKYIANVDNGGYGLLQMSTARLKSRKFFYGDIKKALSTGRSI